MPAMMGNQPTKDNYVKALESGLVEKMKPFPPRKAVKQSGPRGPYPMDARVGRKPGKFGM